MPDIGDYVGNYRLVEFIGQGTFGRVYRAAHHTLTHSPNAQVAIKFLLTDINDPQERAAFLREAHVLDQLKHPAILPILDVGVNADFPYITTEYASGGTLRARLQKRSTRFMPLWEALEIVAPIGEALHYAHEQKPRGIVHRDLKPANILFNAQGKPLLADFGIAIALYTGSIKQSRPSGTPAYMAPEQFEGISSFKCDQYALGCILYELLTGKRPFNFPNISGLEPPMPPARLNPAIPEYIDDAILKALARERNQRHQSVAAFLTALQNPPSTLRKSLLPSRDVPGHQPPRFSTQPPPPWSVLSDGHSETGEVLSNPGMNRSPEPPAGVDLPPAIPEPGIIIFPQEPPSGAQFTSQGSSRQVSLPSSGRSPDAYPLPPSAPDTGHQPPSVQPGAPTGNGNARPPHTPASASLPAQTGWNEVGFTASAGNPGPGQHTGQHAGVTSMNVNVKVPLSSVGDGRGGAGQLLAPFGQMPPPTQLLPPAAPHPRRRRFRRLLLSALLLMLLLLSGSLIFASLNVGGIGGLFLTSTAQVTITPDSRLEQDDFLIIGKTSGTADPNQSQVAARKLTATSATQSVSQDATGSIPATTAHGVLTFVSSSTKDITLGSATLTGSDGVQIHFTGPVTVPAAGSTTVNATAVNPGAQGNIAAQDIFQNCCASNIGVKNVSAFTGGQNAVTNKIITQSDINNATNSLAATLKQAAQAKLQSQVTNEEQVVDSSLNCTNNLTADENAGDKALSVTVTGTVTCAEEVYDFQSAKQIATTDLRTHATSDLGASSSQYALMGTVTTSLVSPVSVASSTGQLSIDMHALGLWVYQFSQQAQQSLKQALSKRSQRDALALLQDTTGVAAARITLSSGDSMPATPDQITITLQKPQAPSISASATAQPVATDTAVPSPTAPQLGGS